MCESVRYVMMVVRSCCLEIEGRERSQEASHIHTAEYPSFQHKKQHTALFTLSCWFPVAGIEGAAQSCRTQSSSSSSSWLWQKENRVRETHTLSLSALNSLCATVTQVPLYDTENLWRRRKLQAAKSVYQWPMQFEQHMCTDALNADSMRILLIVEGHEKKFSDHSFCFRSFLVTWNVSFASCLLLFGSHRLQILVSAYESFCSELLLLLILLLFLLLFCVHVWTPSLITRDQWEEQFSRSMLSILSLCDSRSTHTALLRTYDFVWIERRRRIEQEEEEQDSGGVPGTTEHEERRCRLIFPLEPSISAPASSFRMFTFHGLSILSVTRHTE